MSDNEIFEKLYEDILKDYKQLSDLPGVDKWTKFRIKILNKIFGKRKRVNLF